MTAASSALLDDQFMLDREQAFLDLDQTIADREQSIVDREHEVMLTRQEQIDIELSRADRTDPEIALLLTRRQAELDRSQDRGRARQYQLDQAQTARDERQALLDRQQLAIEAPSGPTPTSEQLETAGAIRRAAALVGATHARRRAQDAMRRAEAAAQRAEALAARAQ